jgi:hypothetical protein
VLIGALLLAGAVAVSLEAYRPAIHRLEEAVPVEEAA